jgi:hypothetical protein
MDETIAFEAKDVVGKIVIIRVADPLNFDATHLNKGFMRAGAVMTLLAKPDDVIEALGDTELRELGLKRIKRARFRMTGLAMKMEPEPPEAA